MPFEKRAVPGAAASGAIAISNVRLFDVDGDKRLDILASEMRTGPVLLGLAKDAHALKPIARLSHPAHIEPVDLDKDGRGDFLVADLGSFQPADHSDGAVYWLRGRADGSYVTVPLATKLPRTVGRPRRRLRRRRRSRRDRRQLRLAHHRQRHAAREQDHRLEDAGVHAAR